MAQTKEPRKTNTLFRKLYKDVILNQVDEKEYSIQMQEFAMNFSRLYLKNAGMKKSNVDVVIDKDMLQIIDGEKEIINISLNENIISGKTHNLSKVGRANNMLELAEDIGVELEVTGMMLQNTKDEELNNRGFYISSKETAPTIMQSIEYSLSKLPTDDKEMVDYDIEELNVPSEYSINIARRKTYFNNFKSIVDMETKSEVVEASVKNSLLDSVLEKMEKENERSYSEESSILNIFAENSELNYSRPEMLVLMHPEIIEKDNSLKNKFNDDGTLIEFDKLIELREKNKEDKRNNGNYKQETLERVTQEIDESFAELMYQKLLNNHSKAEIKDLRKRLGDDKFLKELDTILDVKARVRDDNYNLSVDFVEYAQQNKDKILNNLDLDTKTRFNSVLENVKGDIELRDQEYSKMEERLSFIKDIREYVISTKGQEKRYTQQELEKADNERDLRRINLVGLIGGAFAAIKTGASKTFDDWKKKREEKQKEYDEPIDIEVDIPEPNKKENQNIDDTEKDNSKDKENDDSNKDIKVEEDKDKNNETNPKNEPNDNIRYVEGPPGKDGRDGIDGKDGEPGKDGRDGIDGKDGEPGKDGKDGIDGKDGEPGKDGKDGIDGKDGEPGKDGKDGIDGKDGEPGKDGKDGIDGKDGEPGGNTYIYNTYYTDTTKDKEDDQIKENKEKEIEDEIDDTLINENENTEVTSEDIEENLEKDIDDIDNSLNQEAEDEVSFTINGMPYDEYEKDKEQENSIQQENIEGSINNEDSKEDTEKVEENEIEQNLSKEDIKENMVQELINSKNILLEGLKEQNKIEIEEYRRDLEKRANEIIDSLDTNKYSMEELLNARDHLNERIEKDVLLKVKEKEESLNMIESSMDKYIERKSLEEKLFELEEKRAELKKKEILIQSIEKDAAKSLEDVEKEIEDVKTKIDVNQKEGDNVDRDKK